MKHAILTILGIFACFQVVLAQTEVLYQEDFGTTNSPLSGSATITLAAVGWSQVLLGSGASGIYAQPGAVDQNTGAHLPTNTLYCGCSETGLQMFYTVNGAGAGTGGDSAFTSIDPTLYTNLNLSLESQYSYLGSDMNCYFAVQVGGNWYVSTNHPFVSAGTAGTTFYPSSMTYDTNASNWNNLTVGSTVSIGSPAASNLSGLITGIGVVQVITNGTPYWNYNNFLIKSISNVLEKPTLVAAPLSQTNYTGAGVSFGVAANGTQPFTYYWRKNGVLISNGGNVSGANTNILTITNISGADAATYSVIVSNAAGYFDTSTNSTATLTVNTVPSDYLYAETFPFVGPLSVAYPLSVIGWSNSIPDNFNRLTQSAGGDGAAYAYEGSPMAIAYYVTTASDNGVSGLPFTPVNPSSYPAVSLSVDIAPSYLPANVTAYFAVEMTGGNWYVNQAPISVDTSVTTATYTTYAQQFSAAASSWNTLTINPTSVSIGGQAPANLTGNIVGAGVVFVFTGSGGNFNIDNFLVTTNATPAVKPVITSSPYNQTAYAGAGVSFTVAATGTRPLTYYWQKDGVTLSDNSRISGATSNVLTIVNVGSSDQASIGYVAFVANTAGMDESDNHYNAAQLTVNNPPSGLLYAETFPYIGPTDANNPANEPVSAVGWGEVIAGSPDLLAPNYPIQLGDGFVAASSTAAATTAIFASSSLDTGISGLAFPVISLSSYLSPTFSVDIAPVTTPANVTAYWAIQVGTNWYASTSSLPVPTTASTSYSTYTLAFDRTAANWKYLTLNPNNGAVIGAPAAANLSGDLLGVGLVFVYSGSGGEFDVDNFLVSGTAIGGVTITSVTSTSISLSWNGASNVQLQSTTSLNPPATWSNVPGTLGQSSATVQITGSTQMFFRLIQQ